MSRKRKKQHLSKRRPKDATSPSTPTEPIHPAIALTHAIERAVAPFISEPPPRPPGQFDITIMVAGGQGLSLTNELALVRSALLYADHVTLCSPRTSMLAGTAAFPSLPASARVDMLLEAMPLVTSDPQIIANLELIRKMYKHSHPSPQELALRHTFEATLDTEWQPEFTAKVEELLEESGGGELAPALEAGVLSVDPLIAALKKPETLVDIFFDRLRDAATNPSSYVMFDEAASGLVTSAINAGVIEVTPPAAARQGEARIASEVIARLPAFPSAHVEDVLEVREGLRDAMIQFRRAASRLREMAQASALDPAFVAEADRLYRTEVEPALVEINRTLQSSPLTTALAAAGTMAGIALALLAVPEISGVVREILGAGLVAGSLGGVRLSMQGREAQASGHDLYLLFEVQRKLEVRKSILLT